MIGISHRGEKYTDSWLAHTLNVNNHGVQLGGYKGEIELGDTVAIQYRHKQVQFRVTWIITRKGSLEKQIGAECLEPEKQLWGTAFPEQPDEYEEKTRSSFLGILVAIVGWSCRSWSRPKVGGMRRRVNEGRD